jgi:hypothetical protein
MLTGPTGLFGLIAILTILAELPGYTGLFAGWLYLICLTSMLVLLALEAEYAC